MRARRRSSDSSSRVRFLGSERGKSHRKWFRTLAEYYDELYGQRRTANAYAFLHDMFRRRGPVAEVLDVACGTFAIDLPLVRRGYRVVGRDLSPDMLRVARRNLAAARRTADLAVGDMRAIRVGRAFDALLCLGTAFNYLATAADAEKALRAFHDHLRPGGLLTLDLANFDAWVRHPKNARAETDWHAPDGTRVAVFAFNEQDLTTEVHVARMITLIQKGGSIDIGFDEAPLRIWSKDRLAAALRHTGLSPVEWWGDLRLGARYERTKSPRLVVVALREGARLTRRADARGTRSHTGSSR